MAEGVRAAGSTDEVVGWDAEAQLAESRLDRDPAHELVARLGPDAVAGLATELGAVLDGCVDEPTVDPDAELDVYDREAKLAWTVGANIKPTG